MSTHTTEAPAPGPGTGGAPESLDDDAVLALRGLKTHYFTNEGTVKSVDGVDLTAHRGRTMCVVGESGCGKSVTARSILRLIDAPGKIVAGQIWWQPHSSTAPVDLVTLDERDERLRQIRGGDIGMVFQEPMASLSPMYTVGAQLVETIKLHTDANDSDAKDRAISELRRVGIPQPERRFDSYSFQLSGGMCQRVMIAIALSCDPALLIADEPTTALDVTTQAQILDLIAGLQEETGMAIVFITHDLGVVAEIADDVTVMYLGTVAEQARVTDLFDNPQHPYTQALLESIPTIGTIDQSGATGGPPDSRTSSPISPRAGGRTQLRAISGMVPSPSNRPQGCPFHTRCPHVMPGTCDVDPPQTREIAQHRIAACHLHNKLTAEDLTTGTGLPLLPTPPAPTPAASPDTPARAHPNEPATISDVPPETVPDTSDTPPMLELLNLSMQFPVKKGFLSRTIAHVHAVNNVNLTIRPGETLGLVGESGCGKTTLGRCIARAVQPTSGAIHYHDADSDRVVDLAPLSNNDLRAYRNQIRVIFQDPFSSLNPRHTLLQLIAEPLRKTQPRALANGHGETIRADSTIQDLVADMLRRVGLRPEFMRRYPHAFSGGERQRVNIARALITNPRLVIADEAVSALDVSVRAQILNLLQDLQDEFNLTYLFISHDLSVVEHICDRVAVMYLGNIVEQTDTPSLFTTPRHPYTEALLSAVPIPNPHLRDEGRRIRLADDLPDPTNPPPGCTFHTRCPYAQPTLCATDIPLLEQVGTSGTQQLAACHYTKTLSLAGITRDTSPS